MNLKKIFKIILFVVLVILFFISSSSINNSFISGTAPKKLSDFSSNNLNSKPEFYGTVKIELNVNDELNLKSGFYRIMARDFEDGNITKQIEVVSNNVNTSVAGDYTIEYSVTDKDNNTSNITVPVKVSDTGNRKIYKKFYSYTNYESVYKSKINGMTRGNLQDKQTLGIYLPKGKSVEVKAVTDIEDDLEIQYLSDNSLKESIECSIEKPEPLNPEDSDFFKTIKVMVDNTNTYIKRKDEVYSLKNEVDVKYILLEDLQDGESPNYTSLPNYDNQSYDSVPFLKTSSTSDVELEITLNDDIKPIDYYTYGDNWNENMENDLAIMEGNNVTLLIPRKDFSTIGKPKK